MVRIACCVVEDLVTSHCSKGSGFDLSAMSLPDPVARVLLVEPKSVELMFVTLQSVKPSDVTASCIDALVDVCLTAEIPPVGADRRVDGSDFHRGGQVGCTSIDQL
jgi:hypothetical protein